MTVSEKDFQESLNAEPQKRQGKDLSSSKNTSQNSKILKTEKAKDSQSLLSEKEKSTSTKSSLVGKKKLQKEKLLNQLLGTEEGINEILEGLRGGATLQIISRALKIPYKDLRRTLYSKENKDRTQEAIKEGADAIIEKSEELLTRILPDNETEINPNAARIVLEHYRWLAKVKNPQKYSDHNILHVETRDLTAEHLAELRKINANNNKPENDSL